MSQGPWRGCPGARAVAGLGVRSASFAFFLAIPPLTCQPRRPHPHRPLALAARDGARAAATAGPPAAPSQRGLGRLGVLAARSSTENLDQVFV